MYKPAQLTLGGDQNYSHFVTMDDGLYIPIPSHLLFPHPEIFSHGFDEFLMNTTAIPTCTHTHTCNNAPSSPLVAMHTHTCLHRHTQVLASAEQEPRNPRVIKPLGNREAVRKYREKKKAHAAFLEEEVRSLRAANQQLLRRLQGHAALEAEVVRLTSLLFDVRAKIDAEIGDLPLQQKPCAFGTDHAPCTGEVAAAAIRDVREVDCGIDESGIASVEADLPELADSVMDADELCCLIG
ncbi:basic leucine zipper 23 [Brachypodium distachyon]|uniref:BZIP domain-containing protein n=1 Tax=Brachypodium distachyon TaxID=15368 RepID=A0A0Q3JD32_BRADI|nr:basic leucine zipper 23 [Brachypodium distachyon]XP_010232460.1 basic leucine zipper 23 [Brachypodium distachyon]KQK10195.1 hypothetical protein BRADI_2g52590v3 [Brachypodium distachyon]KQK10196.1 hypothetical protein BRADI_2g52590v3 [Brachypodium distachyon]|eukprot:XP_003567206.2 basic leucine zipper 23 [Brachypodium distachyon]